MPKNIDDKKRMLVRVRKLQGQMQAIERALEGDLPCTATLQQICAVRGALNGLMNELLEIHLKDSLVVGESTALERAEELVEISKILKSYLK